ncbi:conserved hypothetical protein [Trichinella spiralis]|uniref:hypothetical protein n=1 Tax=Trichinella spiralis TaxID=6334 RepID=UPI0001EFC1F4|nr:conserved hypothetical protein [Trichinella spiralis]
MCQEIDWHYKESCCAFATCVFCRISLVKGKCVRICVCVCLLTALIFDTGAIIANVLGRMDNMYNRISEWALSGFSNGSSGSLIALFYAETGSAKILPIFSLLVDSFISQPILSSTECLEFCLLRTIAVNMRKCCSNSLFAKLLQIVFKWSSLSQ